MTTDLLPPPVSNDNRPWHHWLARVRAPFLDSQLAVGHPPQASRLLAIRAQQLTAPAGRRDLARWWGRALDQASRPPITPRAPQCRDRVTAAEGDVRTMLAYLAAPRPITARGAAIAVSLLRDGGGPLYNRRCPLDLGAAVRDATRQMTDFT